NIKNMSSKFNNNYMFSPHGQNTFQMSTPQNAKALSFCANNIKSPTTIKYNNTENKYKIPLNTTLNAYNDKFSVNTEKEVLDHKINLDNILIGKDKRTTVMLRNIPN